MPGKRGRSWKRSPEPKSRQAWLQTIGRFTAPLHRRTRATRSYRHARSRCTETAEPRAACGRARAVAWRASCAPRNDDRSASSLAGRPYPKDLRFLSCCLGTAIRHRGRTTPIEPVGRLDDLSGRLRATTVLRVKTSTPVGVPSRSIGTPRTVRTLANPDPTVSLISGSALVSTT